MSNWTGSLLFSFVVSFLELFPFDKVSYIDEEWEKNNWNYFQKQNEMPKIALSFEKEQFCFNVYKRFTLQKL